MGCTHPKIRLETHERYKNMQGSWSYKAKFIWSEKGKKLSQQIKDLDQMVIAGRYKRYDLIPCGKCLSCYMEYARDKAVQLSLEEKNPEYKDNEKWFITLTYDQETVPYHQTMNVETGELYQGNSVELRDITNWIKRLRKNHPDKKIRYMAAREYGKHTVRPHYHIIIFGLPLHKELFVKIGNNAQGDPLWTTPELDNMKSEDCWKVERNKKLLRAGNIQVGEVTFQSISYVARYTMKKANKDFDSDWWYKMQGMDIEGLSQSQDLGKWYYDLHKHEIYERDTVPIKANDGSFARPPRSYDRLYKKEFPKIYKNVIKRRKQKMLSSIMMKEQQTDMDYIEMLEAEQLNKEDFKDLRGAI